MPCCGRRSSVFALSFSISLMTDSSPTARAITRSAQASLRLVSSSTGLLSLSQLLAMEFELRGTLAIVSGQIQAELSGVFPKNVPRHLETHSYFTDDHRVVIDLSDWDSTFDDEQETGPEDGREGTNVSNVAVVDGE